MAGNTPKTMSSRLMTMKFMQRGAAKSAPSPTTTSASDSPSTSTGPSTKRVRLSAGGFAPRTEAEILQAALDEEERKREEAIERAAEKAGESKWVLSIPDTPRDAQNEGLNVSYAGFAYIDQDEEEGQESGEAVEETSARMVFGGGVKSKKKAQNVPDEESAPEDGLDSSASDSGASESDSESEEYDSDDPTADLIRDAKRHAAEKARENKKAAKSKRRESRGAQSSYDTPKRAIIDEDADLGGLTSLSGGGGLSGGGKRGGNSNVECFGCGGKGHIRSDCPKAGTRGGGGSGGLQRKGSQRGGRGGGGNRGRGGLSGGRQRF